VAHGFGGLVCKKALLLAYTKIADRLYKSILTSLQGIIFLSTPHTGTAVAQWGKWAATALGLTPVVSMSTSLLDVLQTDNEVLEALHDEFFNLIRGMQKEGKEILIVCAFEEVKTKVMKYGGGRVNEVEIVEKKSAVSVSA